MTAIVKVENPAGNDMDVLVTEDNDLTRDSDTKVYVKSRLSVTIMPGAAEQQFAVYGKRKLAISERKRG